MKKIEDIKVGDIIYDVFWTNAKDIVSITECPVISFDVTARIIKYQYHDFYPTFFIDSHYLGGNVAKVSSDSFITTDINAAEKLKIKLISGENKRKRRTNSFRKKRKNFF